MKADALQCSSTCRTIASAQVIAEHLWRGRLVLQAVPEAHLVGNAAQVIVTVVVATAVAVVVVALLAVVIVTLLIVVIVTLLIVVIVALLTVVEDTLLTVVEDTLLTVVEDTLLTVVVVTQLIAVAGLSQALLQVAEVAVDCARTNGALVGFEGCLFSRSQKLLMTARAQMVH